MRILLDTHLLLWWLASSRQLSRQAEQIIADPENEVYVSAASIWELSIKEALGRIHGNPIEIEAALEPSGFIPLPITGKHAAHVSQLPLYHRDPFDRILIAQSMVEPLKFLTHDRPLAQYGEIVYLV